MIQAEAVNNCKTLREWRAFRRLTKAQVAKALGVHPSTYARMEKHSGDVTVREANALAEIFDCEAKLINFFE